MNSALVFVDDGFLSKLSKHFGDGKSYKALIPSSLEILPSDLYRSLDVFSFHFLEGGFYA